MKQYEIDFYREALEKYPEGDARRLGWWSKENQQLRFNKLRTLMMAPFLEPVQSWEEFYERPFRILDFGCGDGSFIFYLWQLNIGTSYVGIDAMEENIAVAKKQVGQAEFIHFAWDGIEPLPIEGEFDFVVESGAFATTPVAIRNHMFRRLINIPSIGFCGNFLTPSQSMPLINPAIVPAFPSEIVRLIDIDIYKFVLFANYLPHDFSIGVYKR